MMKAVELPMLMQVKSKRPRGDEWGGAFGKEQVLLEHGYFLLPSLISLYTLIGCRRLQRRRLL